jgi:hypothetical protein
MKKALDRWPTLPIAVWYPIRLPCRFQTQSLTLEDENNASFALQLPDRIREINLSLTSSLLLKIGSQFLASFPDLEYLRLESLDLSHLTGPTLPVGFLGGSTPQLRHICLGGIAFPTLPLLLSSARDLVSLRLHSVSKSGYFSPETLSMSLSMMTRLKSLRIHFLRVASSVFRETGSPVRPPTARAILPALTKFHFSGDSAYLEDLISRIDFPVLERPFKLSAFGTQQLSQFTSHPTSNLPLHWSFLLWGDQILFVKQFLLSVVLNHSTFHIASEEIDSYARLPLIFTQPSAILYDVQQLDLKSFLPKSPWPL